MACLTGIYLVLVLRDNNNKLQTLRSQCLKSLSKYFTDCNVYEGSLVIMLVIMRFTLLDSYGNIDISPFKKQVEQITEYTDKLIFYVKNEED